MRCRLPFLVSSVIYRWLNKAPQSRGFSFPTHSSTNYLVALGTDKYHFCQRANLSRSFSNASALCRIATGARSGFPPVAISATGGVIRSLGGIGQPEGCIIELEQPAISHTASSIRVFDVVTIYNLLFDDFDSANLSSL